MVRKDLVATGPVARRLELLECTVMRARSRTPPPGMRRLAAWLALTHDCCFLNRTAQNAVLNLSPLTGRARQASLDTPFIQALIEFWQGISRAGCQQGLSDPRSGLVKELWRLWDSTPMPGPESCLGQQNLENRDIQSAGSSCFWRTWGTC